MRILQLSDLYPPVIGGTERHTQRLARELAGRGHESLVATLGTADHRRVEVGQLQDAHRLSRRRPGRR